MQLLLHDVAYDKVIALSRKPLEVTHQKLENIVLEADQLKQHSNLKADDVFCCLGTTIKQAKTKEAFRKVDFDYPLELAKTLHANGAKQFLLVSALGSDRNSSIFYNRVKGEVEDAVQPPVCCLVWRPFGALPLALPGNGRVYGASPAATCTRPHAAWSGSWGLASMLPAPRPVRTPKLPREATSSDECEDYARGRREGDKFGCATGKQG